MTSCSSAYKTIHVSPPSREHTWDSVGQVLSQDQGQMLGTELMEMTEVDYSHFQHLFQAHMEAQTGPPDGPDARSHPAAVIVKDTTGSTVISPFATTQAIDLSTSNDDHCLVMPGEQTPGSYGEVPGFVLARIRGAESPTEPDANGSTSSQTRSRSVARVCLEKRFNTLSADATRQQNIQSAVLSNFLTIFQQSAEAQDTVLHPQTQKWMKTDIANPYDVSSSCVGSVFDPVTNMCGQVIAHMVEPNKHQGLIIPKSFSFNFHPERVVTKAHYTSGSSPAEEQELVNAENVVAPAVSTNPRSTHRCQATKAAKAAPDSAGESRINTRKGARNCMPLSQRRERHNIKERERRKRIRLCCDELNTMVPFCDSDTDKVTTLQWTTAFLRYVNKTYGVTLKEEFEQVFTHEKDLLLKSGSPSGPGPTRQEVDEMLSVPLAAEQ